MPPISQKINLRGSETINGRGKTKTKVLFKNYPDLCREQENKPILCPKLKSANFSSSTTVLEFSHSAHAGIHRHLQSKYLCTNSAAVCVAPSHQQARESFCLWQLMAYFLLLQYLFVLWKKNFFAKWTVNPSFSCELLDVLTCGFSSRIRCKVILFKSQDLQTHCVLPFIFTFTS